ncbi:polysaccharide pyruvyl transferase family protein [Desulfotomaculum copahuensis]|uniref:polysaccharide pyruvyl transferase family protein n=1 Tax=Desulfotomaculum copahuensis TaxID=1838280 RepID=UPI00098E87D2|nr:polysaccharide pyruvyl transferase family protein [Desulfotomaculum copahuensis]
MPVCDDSGCRTLKVAVSGYYGFDNLGDEAVLYSLLDALREYCPGVRPVVLSHAPERTAALYGVEAVNRWRPGEVYRALAGADLLISGGGSLLQDVTGLKSLLYYLAVIWLARRLGRPVVFYAQGIGPVRSWPGRLLMRLVANQVQLITVRDEKSARDLADMGVTRPPVHVTADPVLGLDPAGVDPQPGRELLAAAGAAAGAGPVGRVPLSEDRPETNEAAGEIPPRRKPESGPAVAAAPGAGCGPVRGGGPDASTGVAGRPVAGVSVREWPGFDSHRQRALAGVCDDLCRRGWRVFFIPLHYPEDLAVSREVAALMNKPAAVLDRGLTVPEAVSLFSRLDLLIGMRLHALILAAVLNVPPVGIAYDPKIGRFLEQIGLTPAGEAATLAYGSLRAAVDAVLADPPAFRAALADAVAPLRRRARQTAELVRQICAGWLTGNEHNPAGGA